MKMKRKLLPAVLAAVMTVYSVFVPVFAREAVSAEKTLSRVLVDGMEVSFDAYNIAGNNYFKLRDIAFVLNQTDSQFEVAWDARQNAIRLTSNSAYTAVGGELAAGMDGNIQEAMLSTSTVYLDGSVVRLTAYAIKGNNYFKLRDLGKALDFSVEWNGAENTVEILSGYRYVEEIALTELAFGNIAYKVPDNWKVYRSGPDGNQEAAVKVNGLRIFFHTSEYPLKITLGEMEEDAVLEYADHLKSGGLQVSATDVLNLNGNKFVCLFNLNEEGGTVFLTMSTILDGSMCTISCFREDESVSGQDAELLVALAATLEKTEG